MGTEQGNGGSEADLRWRVGGLWEMGQPLLSSSQLERSGNGAWWAYLLIFLGKEAIQMVLGNFPIFVIRVGQIKHTPEPRRRPWPASLGPWCQLPGSREERPSLLHRGSCSAQPQAWPGMGREWVSAREGSRLLASVWH